MAIGGGVAPVEIADDVVCGGPELLLIAGTCVIEDLEGTLWHAERLAETARRLAMPLVFKASFDKANRSSIHSFRGPGLEAGLEILRIVKERTGLPLVSDVHEPAQCAPAGEVLDMLQIPAFLCRQTDLLVAAAATGRTINVKKGQFLSPWDVAPLLEKLRSAGARKILVTDRGVSFGYNTLVSDMRSIPVVHGLGVPLVFDATHSVQRPGGRGSSSGGDPEFIPTLAAAAVGGGADAVFMEVHRDPAAARSDSANALPLDHFEPLVAHLARLRHVVFEARQESR